MCTIFNFDLEKVENYSVINVTLGYFQVKKIDFDQGIEQLPNNFIWNIKTT